MSSVTLLTHIDKANSEICYERGVQRALRLRQGQALMEHFQVLLSPLKVARGDVGAGLEQSGGRGEDRLWYS